MMHYNADTLDDYLHGALGPERDAAIHAHLEACADCRALYDEAASVRDWLRAAARAEEREFPSMIKARVWEAVRAMPAPPRSPIACARSGARLIAVRRRRDRRCRLHGRSDRSRRQPARRRRGDVLARRTCRSRLRQPARRSRAHRAGFHRQRPANDGSDGRGRYGGHIGPIAIGATLQRPRSACGYFAVAVRRHGDCEAGTRPGAARPIRTRS